MLVTELKKRNLPPVPARDEAVDLLCREEYGYLPPTPDAISFAVERNVIRSFCAGAATVDRITASCVIGETSFSFPFYVTLPTKEGKHPFFVMINFRRDVPDRYMPSEELIDSGFAVLSFSYTDVTSDDGDFTNGLAGVLYPDGVRGNRDAGKIAMWAWAAQRVMDYADQEPRLDKSCVIVCGHSRLGKTALFCGATDDRFTFVYSNDSGCSGAAITRDKVGETVEVISSVFPHWFCKSYRQYANREHEMPFDQHFLIASVAPRYAYVASAWEDSWADPASEMLSCVAATPAYEAMGLEGFICDDRLPETGDRWHTGHIGYHLRPGEHYFGREDWNTVMDFIHSKR